MTALRITNLGRGLCLGGASLGVLALIGWLTGVEVLYSAIPGGPPMMPNTAISTLLLGIAGALRHPRTPGPVRLIFCASAAIAVLMINLGTLAQYALDLNLGLERLFLPLPAGPNSGHLYPGLTSPHSATGLALLAAAILVFDARPAKRLRPAEWLILTAGMLGFIALLGQLFGAGPLYRLALEPAIGSSISTALSFIMISFGLLLERPDAGVTRVIAAPSPGGVLLRRLALAAVLAPLASELIATKLLQIPSVDNVDIVDFLFAAVTVVSAVTSLFLLAITAVRLDRTHDTLEQSRQEARNLIALASEGIFIADLEGRYVDVNDSACRMLGYSRKEILGKTILDLIPPEDEDRLRTDREKFLHGSTDVSEWGLLTKSGTYLPVEVSAKILPDGRWQAFVRDISERKRAEEVLRQAQERLELALKGADLATWDWNVKTGKIIFSPRWAEMRGFRPEEIEPHVDSAFADIHPDDLSAVQKALDDCFEGHLPEYEMTFRISAKNGDWIWLLSRGKVFGRDERGRPTRMVGTAFDITARKRTEEALRLSEAAAKQATQARDDILGIVAHDLRNPLAAIASLAHVLRAKGPEAEVGDEIVVAANRMNRLIGDLLDVTRIEAGHLSLKQERLPSAEIVTDALEGQTPLASSASLELRLEVAPELPDISADRDRLLQVFENLIGNAIKFTKPGGRITLGATARAGEVTFAVSDSGRGIASTHLPHVFDRFWQAPGTERRGMGFGLAIVKGVVEAHGGRVWVQSSPGQGSTFFFTIPTAAAQTAASHAAQ